MKINKIKRRWGGSLIEFAVVAPIFFLITFGLIEVSRMMMIQEALTNAAREGCREAALVTTTSTSEVDSVVRNYLQGVTVDFLDPNIVRVDITPSNFSSVDSGTTVSVDVEVTFSDLSWLPGSFVAGQDFQISGNAIKQRE